VWQVHRRLHALLSQIPHYPQFRTSVNTLYSSVQAFGSFNSSYIPDDLKLAGTAAGSGSSDRISVGQSLYACRDRTGVESVEAAGD